MSSSTNMCECDSVEDCLCPQTRPSPIFSSFAIAVNVLGGLLCLIFAFQSCDSSTRIWSFLGIASHVVNCCFAVYLYARFTHKVRNEGSGVGAAAWKLVVFDWGVWAYWAFCVWLIVYMIVAGSAASGSSSGDKCSTGLSLSIVFMIIYAIGGPLLIFLSLFTECCRKPRWTGAPPEAQQAQAQPQLQPQGVGPGYGQYNYGQPAPQQQTGYTNTAAAIRQYQDQQRQQQAMQQQPYYAPQPQQQPQPQGYVQNPGAPPPANPNYSPA